MVGVCDGVSGGRGEFASLPGGAAVRLGVSGDWAGALAVGGGAVFGAGVVGFGFFDDFFASLARGLPRAAVTFCEEACGGGRDECGGGGSLPGSGGEKPWVISACFPMRTSPDSP